MIISEINGLSKLLKFQEFFDGKRILLVTGKKSFMDCGAQQKIYSLLENQNITYFSDFETNPKLLDAVTGTAIARANKIEVIIAIGGGSVIDIAKLIKGFYLAENDEVSIAKGLKKVQDPMIPILAIPTTAGSGSEATHFCVVYIGEKKYSVAANCLLPDAVILDASLVLSANKYQKGCNALDSLAQAIESAWASGSTSESREYSYSALNLGWKNLFKFIDTCCDLETAQNMLQASYMAGKAINISKTTAAHAWSYAITTKYGTPHGHAVWLTLPAIFKVHFSAKKMYVHDTRGKNHLIQVMSKLQKILNLDEKVCIETQLKLILKKLDIEPKLEKVGADTKEDRRILSEKLNVERMKNNPMNLDAFKEQIFQL